MEPYLFHGKILPERATLTDQFSQEFLHIGSGVSGVARISILLNQVAVWIDSNYNWNVFDLRNVVKHIIQNHLAIIGYLTGLAYEVEVTRVLNQSRKIDYVFGIDIPCIAERGNANNLKSALNKLRNMTMGHSGVFLNRCFSDLVSAMKHADDTGFYCYRAIESLCHHCASENKLSNAPKSKQWEKFREISGCSKDAILYIKGAADPLRHGDINYVSPEDRKKLFTSTWDIVDSYIAGV